MNIVSYIGVLVAAGLISATVSAADVPAEIVTKAVELQKTQPVTQESLQDRWESVLEKSGWGEGAQEGGVLIFPDRNLIVSSGEEFTRVPIGQPGWVESRVVAYERAELQAKAKIIRYFTETTDTSRSLEMFEQASWSDGTVAEVRDIGEAAEIIEKIGKKSLDITDAMLDKALRKLDPDYDPGKYESLTPDKLKVVVEDLFKRRVSSMAFRSLIGVTPLYTTEGEVGGQYQVLVGVVWSPKLNNVALSLSNDVYNLPPVPPGAKIETAIPEDPNVLIGTMGTRVVVDEKGQFAVIAYAQAQPRRAAPSRQQSAIHTAKKVAENRARAQIVNFVKESLSVRSTETFSELSREYSDLTVGTEAVRNYQEKIAGSQIRVSMRGLRTLKEWQFPHPVTGEPVVGAVLAWTPSSAEMATEMEQVMKQQAHQAREASMPKKEISKPEQPLESMPVNTSHY
jgi:hypothetical protein